MTAGGQKIGKLSHVPSLRNMGAYTSCFIVTLMKISLSQLKCQPFEFRFGTEDYDMNGDHELILFNNNEIQIGGKTVFYQDWFD